VNTRHGSRETTISLRRDNRDSSATPAQQESPAAFPVDLLDALEQTWQTICSTYDAEAELPDVQVLFEGADLTTPDQAAETVLANMLLEVMYSISRFSPWYKKPLGLRLIRDDAAHRSRWALSPNTYQQWQGLLEPLSVAIKSNVCLILAADLVDGLVEKPLPPDRVMATCQCVPARLILVKRTVLVGADITCDTCRQPFRPVEAADAGNRDSRPV